MANRGFVTTELSAGRINAHGKIASLATAFKKNNPFSILIVPKADVTTGVISNVAEEIGLIVSVRTYQNDAAADLPVYFHRWTEASIVELPITAIDLNTYDVYWGSGVND